MANSISNTHSANLQMSIEIGDLIEQDKIQKQKMDVIFEKSTKLLDQMDGLTKKWDEEQIKNNVTKLENQNRSISPGILEVRKQALAIQGLSDNRAKKVFTYIVNGVTESVKALLTS